MFDYGEAVAFDDIEHGKYRFVRWNNECPKTMPAKNFALIALVDEIDPTGLSRESDDALMPVVADGKIYLPDGMKGDVVCLYDMSGRLVYRGVASCVEVSVPGVYLLTFQGMPLKIVVT